MLGSDEGIKLGLSSGKVLVAILIHVDRITLGLDIGIELGSSDGSLDGSTDGKVEGLLFEDSLGSTGAKVHGNDEGIKLRLSDSIVIDTILRNVDGIILGIDVVEELGYLDGSFDSSNDRNFDSFFQLD